MKNDSSLLYEVLALNFSPFGKLPVVGRDGSRTPSAYTAFKGNFAIPVAPS